MCVVVVVSSRVSSGDNNSPVKRQQVVVPNNIHYAMSSTRKEEAVAVRTNKCDIRKVIQTISSPVRIQLDGNGTSSTMMTSGNIHQTNKHGHLLGIARRNVVYSTITNHAQVKVDDDDMDTQIISNQEAATSGNLSIALSMTTCSIPLSSTTNHEEDDEKDDDCHRDTQVLFVNKKVQTVDTDESIEESIEEALSDAHSSISGITNPTYVESSKTRQHSQSNQKQIASSEASSSNATSEAMTPLIANSVTQRSWTPPAPMNNLEAPGSKQYSSNSYITKQSTSTAFEPFSSNDDVDGDGFVTVTAIAPEWNIQSPPQFSTTSNSVASSVQQNQSSRWEADFNNMDSSNFFRDDLFEGKNTSFEASFEKKLLDTPNRQKNIDLLFDDKTSHDFRAKSVSPNIRKQNPSYSQNSYFQKETNYSQSSARSYLSDNRTANTSPIHSSSTDHNELFNEQHKSLKHSSGKSHSSSSNSNKSYQGLARREIVSNQQRQHSPTVTMDPILRRKMLERARKLKDSRRRLDQIKKSSSSDYSMQIPEQPPILHSISSSTSAFSPTRQNHLQPSTINASKAVNVNPRLKDLVIRHQKLHRQRTKATVIDLNDSLSNCDEKDNINELQEEHVIRATKSNDDQNQQHSNHVILLSRSRVVPKALSKHKAKSDVGIGNRLSSDNSSSLLTFRKRMSQRIQSSQRQSQAQKSNYGYTSDSSMTSLQFGTEAYNECLEVD